MLAGAVMGYAILGPAALHNGWVSSISGLDGASGWIMWVRNCLALQFLHIRIHEESARFPHGYALGHYCGVHWVTWVRRCLARSLSANQRIICSFVHPQPSLVRHEPHK
jgi:hypothetical protein